MGGREGGAVHVAMSDSLIFKSPRHICFIGSVSLKAKWHGEMWKSQFHSRHCSLLFTWAISLLVPVWVSLVSVGTNQLDPTVHHQIPPRRPANKNVSAFKPLSIKRVMKTVRAPTEREPGFFLQADGIDLKFYHFLCHKSPRLWSQCQHFSPLCSLKMLYINRFRQGLFFSSEET